MWLSLLITPEPATSWFHPLTPGSICQICAAPVRRFFFPSRTVWFKSSSRSFFLPTATTYLEGRRDSSWQVDEFTLFKESYNHVDVFVKAAEYCEEFYSVHVCLCIGTSIDVYGICIVDKILHQLGGWVVTLHFLSHRNPVTRWLAKKNDWKV